MLHRPIHSDAIRSDDGQSPCDRRATRVLIVDDSMVAQAVIRRILEDTGRIEVVGGAPDTAAAIAMLHDNPCDLVLLDIEMPGRSGIDALPDILAVAGPRTPVMILSAHGRRSAPLAVKALSLGAADTLAKPGLEGFSGRFGETLVAMVDQLCQQGGDGAVAADAPAAPSHYVPNKFVPDKAPCCIAIGASTGGLSGTFRILADLDAAISAPILITQHLPDAFMPSYVRQLQQHSTRPVLLAADGMAVRPGHVYVATGQAHMRCVMTETGPVIRFDHGQYAVRYTPSVDPMFESVADCFGDGALAIALSGMGRDGACAAARLKQVDAVILVQDMESSVVWGMPGAIMKNGHADGMGTPAEIAAMINAALPCS